MLYSPPIPAHLALRCHPAQEWRSCAQTYGAVGKPRRSFPRGSPLSDSPPADNPNPFDVRLQRNSLYSNLQAQARLLVPVPIRAPPAIAPAWTPTAEQSARKSAMTL